MLDQDSLVKEVRRPDLQAGASFSIAKLPLNLMGKTSMTSSRVYQVRARRSFSWTDMILDDLGFAFMLRSTERKEDHVLQRGTCVLVQLLPWTYVFLLGVV